MTDYMTIENVSTVNAELFIKAPVAHFCVTMSSK